MKKDSTFEKRLQEKIQINENGCWIWLGSLNKGYGQIYYNGKLRKTHRASYQFYRGDFDQKLQIDHLCNTPECCNPYHLEPVTNKENNSRITDRPGRKKVGQPISVALTPELRDWLDSKIEHGGTRSEVIRRILFVAMMKEGNTQPKEKTKCLSESQKTKN